VVRVDGGHGGREGPGAGEVPVAPLERAEFLLVLLVCDDEIWVPAREVQEEVGEGGGAVVEAVAFGGVVVGFWGVAG